MRLAAALLATTTAACYQIDTPPFEAPIDASTVDASLIDAGPTECPASDPPRQSPACNESEPICDATGTCVECTLDGECDSGSCNADGTCACTHHTQCDSGACGLYDGEARCVPEDEIAYVNAAAPGSNTECTRSDPCRLISQGLGKLRTYTVLVPGSSFQQSVIFGTTLQHQYLIGYGTELRSDMQGIPALRIGTGTAGVVHHVEGVHIASDMLTGGVVVTDLTVAELVDVTVTGVSGVAIDVGPDGTLRVRRSRIVNNADGGMRTAPGARLEIYNSVISGNGGAASELGGILLDQPSVVSVAFNTLTGNSCSTETCAAPAIECTGCQNASSVGGTAGGEFHSNLIVNNAVAGGQAGQVNQENGFPVYEACIFAGDPGFAADGYHLLAPSSPAVDQGKDQINGADAIIEDIDGQPRPLKDPDVGADECVPDAANQMCE